MFICRSYLLISFLLILTAFSMWILFLHCSIYLVISMLSNHLPLHTASLFPPHIASHFSRTCFAISIYSAFTTYTVSCFITSVCLSVCILFSFTFQTFFCYFCFQICVLMSILLLLLASFHCSPNLVLHNSQFFMLCSSNSRSWHLFLHEESLTELCYVTMSCVRQHNKHLTHYVKTASPPLP